MLHFRAAACVCGHALGEHGRATAGLHVSRGRCFRCDCGGFRDIAEVREDPGLLADCLVVDEDAA
jgi:hypothetical protein